MLHAYFSPHRTQLISALIILLLTFLEISCNKSSSPGNQQSNSGGSGGTTPQFTAIRPTNGSGGSADTISGSGFGTSASLDSLYINGVKAVVTAGSDSQLIVTVPSLCGTGKVTLVKNSVTVTGPVFTYDTIYGLTTLAQGFSNPQHLAVDTAGNIYVTDKGDGTVKMISPGGTVSTFISGMTEPMGITVDANNSIYVSDYDSIYKYNVQGTGIPWAATDPNGFIWSLTSDNAGNIYALYWDGTLSVSVAKISSSGTESNLISDAGYGMATGICVNPAGGFYLAGGNNGAQNFIYTLSNSGAFGQLNLGGYIASFAPSDLIVRGDDLYVSSLTSNSLYKINSAGQAEAIVTTPPAPFGAAVDKSGEVIVCSWISSASDAGEVSKLTYK